MDWRPHIPIPNDGRAESLVVLHLKNLTGVPRHPVHQNLILALAKPASGNELFGKTGENLAIKGCEPATVFLLKNLTL